MHIHTHSHTHTHTRTHTHPHTLTSSLSHREGAIDRLIRLYKEVVPRTNGYLTHNGTVNLTRVQMMMTGKIFNKFSRFLLNFFAWFKN